MARPTTFFGFPSTPKGRGAALAAQLAWTGSLVGRTLRYSPGVGVTFWWHGWELGRDGGMRPLPLTGE